MQIEGKLLQSPLNYTGGKYRLLPQILPLFPEEIDTFVDLFCGGGSVGCNVTARKIIYNDIDSKVIALLQYFSDTNKENIFKAVEDIILEYGLSNVSEKGYEYYHCDSAKGLAAVNRNGFNRLRADFNKTMPNADNYCVILYVLIIYAFNNQIRFNSKGEYNLPVGKRDFNARMQQKLSDFVEKLQSMDCSFSNLSFGSYDISSLTPRDLVYCDPPYLITCATYTENGLWNAENELKLLGVLDDLDRSGIRFALSNVLVSKGKKNHILEDWLASNPQYYCHHLVYNYSNSNYHTKDRDSMCDEVLIINYKR